jgi:glycosyltransferase involved in cell wall biosynthesis
MRILFLSPDFVLPADRGLRVRSLSQLRLLSAFDDVEAITFLSLADYDVAPAELGALERKIPKLTARAPVRQPIHMRQSPRSLPRLLGLRILGRVPYLVAKADNSSMRRLLRAELQRGRYDLVYFGYFGMTAYLPMVRRLAPRARLVLEEHNVEWEIFERLARSYKGVLRQAVKWEARAMRRFEREVLRAVDAVVAISRADADTLHALSGVRAAVVPPFVEPRSPRVEKEGARGLVYIGLLAWQPNALGLDWFCREVWPIVRQLAPEATLTIAGPGLRKRGDGSLVVPNEWSAPGIRTVGFVDDLEELYAGARAMVAPVLGGSGVRMKLLEAMSAGMPVITTSDGALGLELQDGHQILIADEPRAFAQRVAMALADAPLRERLRTSGRDYVVSHHSRSVASAQLLEALALPPPEG